MKLFNKENNREMVSYWKTSDSVLAKITKAPEGHYVMHMEGEKYPFPGYPRGRLLYGKLSPLKHWIKNKVFNESWALLEEGKDIQEHFKTEAEPYIFNILEDMKYDLLPQERLVPAVKEIHRAMTAVGAEKWRDVICFIFQEDDAYRMRFQWIVKFFPKFLKPSIEDFKRGFDMLEHAETIGDMKERVRLVRRVLLELLKDSKKFKAFLREVDWRKVALTKADKYFFRAKYFKVDYPEFQY